MADTRRQPLTVPNRGDPDRKRALNVLAQRRYRQRRREKIQALEKKVQSSKNADSPETPRSSSSRQSSDSSGGVATSQHHDSGHEFSPEITQTHGMVFNDDIIFEQSLDFNSFLLPGTFSDTPSDLGSTSLARPSSPAFDILSTFTQVPTMQTTVFAVSDELQSLESSQFTFPDEDLMPIPEFAVMKAGFNIAELLGCTDSMWDLAASRTFDRTSIPTPHIPPNLEPTEAQKRIPHHPLFDIFPWPSVRTRVICVFSQPPHMRPVSAREPDAVMKLFYDMDDSAEGMRVSGSDWYDGDNWEIGQAIFKNWWWAFDRSVIANSNALRRKRGAKLLTM